MSRSFSNKGEELFLKHFLGISSYAMPKVRLQLHYGDPGENCTANVASGRGTTTYSYINDGVSGYRAQNNITSCGSASAGTISHWSAWDAASGGNPLFYGDLLKGSYSHDGGAISISGNEAGITAENLHSSSSYQALAASGTASTPSLSQGLPDGSGSVAATGSTPSLALALILPASSGNAVVTGSAPAMEAYAFATGTATASFTASCNASNASFATAEASAAFTATCDASIITPVASCAVTFTATCALQPLPTTSTTLFCAIEERTVCNVSASLLTVCNVSLLNVTDLPSSGIIST